MKTINDFSAPSAKGLGGAVRRTAMMLLMMLLTTTTAWAFKLEEKSYRINSNGAQFSIFPSGQSTPTASWAATRLPQTSQTIYYWEKNDSHNFDGDMTISPNADVYSTSSDNTNWIIHTNVTTTFTFNAPSGIITNVSFRNGDADVTPSSSSGADTSTYTVTLADNTTFTGFEVTFYATSGSCGTNATWELTTDGSGNYTVLTIGGSGAMENYDHINDAIWHTTAPWGYNLTSVTIGDDITSIGDYAFIGCQQLSSLTIGSSVTSIGTNAIDHCDGLTEVTLPASISTIGDGGFKNCVGLTRVNIQYTEGLVTLGSSCFNGCDNLQYIVAPTPALALQYKDATNWSASAGKLRVALGDYLFTATDEGGTAAYAITNETDLRNLSAAVIAGNTASGYTFRQTANITLGNTGFRPIGKNDNICFSGTYDGGDYTISGLHVIKIDGFYYYGLFGYVKNGTVKNVRLISPSVNVDNVDINYFYSALVGKANSSTVKNCVVITPTIEGSSGNKGAIIGKFENSSLQNLYFYGGNCNIAVGAGSNISTVCRARKVTLGSGIGSVSPDANSMDNGFVYNNERYYREGLTLTLTTNLTENTGYHPVYKVNGNAINGNTYTVNSTDGDVTLTAEYTPDIHYIDADGNRQTRSDYTVLTNATNISNLSAGWYVVESNVSYSSQFRCESGDIHLILCDNAKMTIEPTQDEAMVMSLGSLTVYAQSTGNSMGQLEAISSNRTAISSDVNNITICGGKITATGSTSDENSGIYAGGNTTIHGGQVSATGKYGIRAYEGNVILGLRNANDYITANSYKSYRGSIRIADGQTLTDGTAIYSGTLTDAQISAIGGKTLRRAYSATLTVSGHGSVALGGTVGVLTDGKIYAASGETVTLSDTPEAGYMVGYTASGVTVTNGTFTMPANDNAAIAASFTAITYDIIYHANGGTLSTNKNSYTVESPDITLDVPTRTGYTFLGWYDNSGLTGTAVTTIAHGSTGNVELWAKWINSTSYYFGPGNDGSTEHPYVISDADGWNYFCDALAGGETFSGKTVKLGNNIGTAQEPITRMAGSNDHRFAGTFDGQGHTLTVSYEDTGDYTMTAPFSYVDGATIQNLVVGGSITDTGFRAAGIIGETSENLSHITNCVSSVNISGGRYTAGFSIGGKVAIEGCVFNGKIVGTQYSGGFVGWSYNGLAITNCLFAPQDGSSISGGTFYYNGGDGEITPTNSYYTTALGTAQGKAKRTVTAGTGVSIQVNPVGSETATYTVSGINAYAKGITRTVDNVTTFYYGEGDDVSLTLSNTPSAGYIFSSYEASDGSLSGTENPYTLTMPASDVTVTATFSPISYTIGYDLAGGSVETDNPTTYTVESDDITLNNPTREGYTFAGWTGTGLDAATMSVTIAKGSTGNKTFYAQWTAHTYTVQFNKNASDATGTMTDQGFTYDVAQNLTDNAFTRTGYTFAGWATSTGGDVVYSDGDNVSNLTATDGAIVTLYAQWTAHTYTVQFDKNHTDATGEMGDQGFTYDEAQELTANGFTRTHYDFVGWNTQADGSGTSYTDQQSVSNLTPTDNGTVTLYAQWTPHTYTIAYNLDGGSVDPANRTEYNVETETFTLTNPTRDGYFFRGWTGTGLDAASMSVTIAQGSSGNRSYTATWEAVAFSVHFNGNGSTDGEMSNQGFTYDAAQPLTANGFTRAFTVTYEYNGGTGGNNSATANATFNGWATTADGEVVYTDQQSVSNLTTKPGDVVNLYANWTDASIILPTPTRTGYTFVEWCSDANLTTKIGDAGDEITPTTDLTLYAHWILNTSIDVSLTSPLISGDDAYITVTMTPKDISLEPNTITTVAQVSRGYNFYSVPIVNGVGTCIVNNMAEGTYDIRADFYGDDRYKECSSDVKQLVVEKIPTTITMSLDKTTINAGEPVTVNVELVPHIDGTLDVVAHRSPRETVHESIDHYTIAIVNGRGTITFRNFEEGTRYIYALYNGDNNNNRYKGFVTEEIALPVKKPTINVDVSVTSPVIAKEPVKE